MYGFYTPSVVYGVKDLSSKVLDSEFLDEVGLELWHTEVSKNQSMGIVYGLPVKLNDMKKIKKVDTFALKYKFEEPSFMVCIQGDVSLSDMEIYTLAKNDKVVCDCGLSVKKVYLNRHMKTKKHSVFMSY